MGTRMCETHQICHFTPNMPFWCKDYFEKADENYQPQEKLFSQPLSDCLMIKYKYSFL